MTKCMRMMVALGLNATVASVAIGQQYMLVTDCLANRIIRFDFQTGAPVSQFTSRPDYSTVEYPREMVVGPDGVLYVCSALGDAILRYDVETGRFLGVHVSSGLNNPTHMVFDSQGRLYVASADTDQVIRYSADGLGSTVFATGIDTRGLVFSPDGAELWVANRLANSIVRLNATTGASLGALIPGGTSGLTSPQAIALDSDGNLFVASAGSNSIIRRTPAGIVSVFISSSPSGLINPEDVKFDANGDLIVSSTGQDASTGTIRRFSRENGSLMDTLVQEPAGVPNGRYSHILLLSQNAATPCEQGDINRDGVVDLIDLATLLSVFGTVCP